MKRVPTSTYRVCSCLRASVAYNLSEGLLRTPLLKTLTDFAVLHNPSRLIFYFH